MAAAKDERPLIIVRKARRGEGGHHGGAWKVAYADFVTAMMAFFLVMWIVTAVNKAQRAAIFNYFKNPSMQTGHSTRAAPGPQGPGGASTSPINLGGGLNGMNTSPHPLAAIRAPQVGSGSNDSLEATPKPISTLQARKRVAQADHKRLESLMAQLRQAVDKSQALKPFKNQLLLDITPRGVRIQIVDAKNRPMFDLGSAKLRGYTRRILQTLAPYLNSVPNQIAIIGHTDAHPYPGHNHYTNWELSADRANAARRALVQGGLKHGKVARVVGLASTVLFDKTNPFDPINRRISIIVMTRREAEAALRADTGSADPSAPSDPPPAAPSEPKPH
ncbi:MAG: flagellar motor protein MotB [Steroidobacteraceae bacterium]